MSLPNMVTVRVAPSWLFSRREVLLLIPASKHFEKGRPFLLSLLSLFTTRPVCFMSSGSEYKCADFGTQKFDFGVASRLEGRTMEGEDVSALADQMLSLVFNDCWYRRYDRAYAAILTLPHVQYRMQVRGQHS